MKKIKSQKCASIGISMGRVFVVEKADITPDSYTVDDNKIELEIEKYKNAVNTVVDELKNAAKTSDIFAAHIELVQDISLESAIKDEILNNKYNVQNAVEKVLSMYVKIFEDMDDKYMRERALDMKDIKERLLYALKGISSNPYDKLVKPSIIVAKDLNPSDTIRMDMKYVKGFITKLGGVTSHVSIIAKNMGIPALVGVSDILEQCKNGDLAILDATNKTIIINPEDDVVSKYNKLIEDYEEEVLLLEKLKDVEAVTIDGKRIELCANVGNIEDVKSAKKAGVDGIGLFRSEFLYMENTHFPTEDEQFEVYKEAVEILKKQVIVRTLDIGGDKGLPYFEFEQEENPFLGFRAIRMCLEEIDMFKTQLRALLRASAYGDIQIMYPMIISEDEVDSANSILKGCMKELDEQKIPYNKDIKVGIMIETPASVLCAKELANKVDFFSIGTNDLTQYITAVDRGNKKIAHLYDTKNPAVLRAIKYVINAGHEAGIKVGMCGEFAGDETATELLLGLGLDEFSMSHSSINRIKSIILKSQYNIAKDLTYIKEI